MRPARGENSHPDIKVDPEFADLIPPLAADELAALTERIREEGCLDALIVWKETRLLLDGHNRLRICREHGTPFRIFEKEFPDREAAKEYILRHQLTRRNLSPEAASYLRGKRYLSAKHQGTAGGASGQSDPKRTSEMLADEYKVGEKTIRRDAKFAEAVDEIVANCGEGSRKWILSRDAGLTRGGVAKLVKLKAREQRTFIQHLMKTGKRPRRKHPPLPRCVRLPTERGAMVAALLDYLGVENAADFRERFSKALDEAQTARK